jgi:hypothetical protein
LTAISQFSMLLTRTRKFPVRDARVYKLFCRVGLNPVLNRNSTDFANTVPSKICPLLGLHTLSSCRLSYYPATVERASLGPNLMSHLSGRVEHPFDSASSTGEREAHSIPPTISSSPWHISSLLNTVILCSTWQWRPLKYTAPPTPWIIDYRCPLYLLRLGRVLAVPRGTSPRTKDRR